LILTATRRPGGDYRANISRHLALAVTAFERWSDGCRVVGVDLAGYEDKETRAHYYTEEFVTIHRCGIAITVHAGENDNAEAIWQAVFNLNARRLGHALSLSKSLELSRSIADRKIAVELCPYSNYQIKGYKLYNDGIENDNRPEYPINEYLKKGIKVTINTDNIGISNASLTDNFAFLTKLSPGITRRQVLQILRNSVDSTFIPADEQTKLQMLTEKLLPSPNF
jgi:adenosine deaminase